MSFVPNNYLFFPKKRDFYWTKLVTDEVLPKKSVDQCLAHLGTCLALYACLSSFLVPVTLPVFFWHLFLILIYTVVDFIYPVSFLKSFLKQRKIK